MVRVKLKDAKISIPHCIYITVIHGTNISNPAGDQEKSSRYIPYCSYKNHNFANIGHKNMNYVSF